MLYDNSPEFPAAWMNLGITQVALNKLEVVIMELKVFRLSLSSRKLK